MDHKDVCHLIAGKELQWCFSLVQCDLPATETENDDRRATATSALSASALSASASQCSGLEYGVLHAVLGAPLTPVEREARLVPVVRVVMSKPRVVLLPQVPPMILGLTIDRWTRENVL